MASQPTTYRRHFIRAKDNLPPLILQDRDLAILHALHENRFLTLSLLAHLFPPNAKDRTRRYRYADVQTHDATFSGLRRRLSKLFHHGYLYRFRTVVGGEHIYALDTKGARLLKERQLSLFPDDWRPNKETPATLFVDHTLMVARFRASLQRALLAHPRYTLQRFEREGLDLKAEWRRNNQRIYVNPDAFFILQDTTTNAYLAYFLEADLSTMQLSRVLGKYKNYSLLYEDRQHIEAFGIQDFHVLTVCKSTARAANILTLAASDTSPIPAANKSFFYFTTDEVYTETPTNVFAAIWRRADDVDTQRAIIAAPLSRL